MELELALFSAFHFHFQTGCTSRSSIVHTSAQCKFLSKSLRFYSRSQSRSKNLEQPFSLNSSLYCQRLNFNVLPGKKGIGLWLKKFINLFFLLNRYILRKFIRLLFCCISKLFPVPLFDQRLYHPDECINFFVGQNILIFIKNVYSKYIFQ